MALGKAGGKKRVTSLPQERHRQVEAYDQWDMQRVNNPPVGLVTPDTDPGFVARKVYSCD